jgi:hypothetical protein
MPKASPLQSSFNAGEFSPLTQGRIDADRYKTGLAKCEGWLPLAQGPVTRMPGTYYVGAVKDSTAKTRLQGFEFSTLQAYMIEFGNLYIRFYRNYGIIESPPGTPVEVVTPYTTAEVFELKFAQSADTLYITHPNHPPAKLTRTSHTAWTYTVIDFQDGPYLDLVPSSPSGNMTSVGGGTGAGVAFVAASTTHINDGAGFKATDVGRPFRVFTGGAVMWGNIDSFTDSTHITVNIRFGTVPAATTMDSWRIGVWSATTGYPAAVCFHEDRLTFAGSKSYPDRVMMSNSSDYENFEPTQANGTVVAGNAVSFTINSTEINAIQWLVSDEKGLNLGTVGSEWNVRPSSQGEAITPTNVTAKKTTSYGSANVQPVQIGKATMFLQRGGRKVREMVFFYDVDGYRANDLTLLSEHITGAGITQMALQKLPQQLVWCVRSDGQLAAMNYEREVDTLKVGWCRRVLGSGGDLLGGADDSGLPAKVESVAVIPSPDGTRDDVWVVVNRYFGGATHRYIEFMTKIFEATDEQADAIFVDAALTYDVPLGVTGITAANPPVATVPGQLFANGDKVRFEEIIGLRAPGTSDSPLNGPTFVVASTNHGAGTFTLKDLDGNNIDGSTWSPYLSGGEVRKEVTAVSGLSHLDGLVVSVYADGAAQSQKTVSSGAITLDAPATVVQVGLPYNSDLQFLRPDVGAASGTAHGKKRRVNRMGLDYYRTQGFKLGPSFSELDTIEMRERSDLPGRASSLKSGIDVYEIGCDYDYDNRICLRVSGPTPATILAAMPWLEEQDG